VIISATPDFRLDDKDIFPRRDPAADDGGTHTDPCLDGPPVAATFEQRRVHLPGRDSRLASTWPIVDSLAFCRLAG